MKKLLTLVVILSLGLFVSVGCTKSATTKKAGEQKTEQKAEKGQAGGGAEAMPPAKTEAEKK